MYRISFAVETWRIQRSYHGLMHTCTSMPQCQKLNVRWHNNAFFHTLTCPDFCCCRTCMCVHVGNQKGKNRGELKTYPCGTPVVAVVCAEPRNMSFTHHLSLHIVALNAITIKTLQCIQQMKPVFQELHLRFFCTLLHLVTTTPWISAPCYIFSALLLLGIRSCTGLLQKCHLAIPETLPMATDQKSLHSDNKHPVNTEFKETKIYRHSRFLHWRHMADGQDFYKTTPE